MGGLPCYNLNGMKYLKRVRGPISIALLFALLFVHGVRAGGAGSGRLGSPVSVEAGSGWDQAPTYTGCGGVFGVLSSNEDYEWEVVRLVNQERTSRGLAPLKRVPSLDDAARYHSKDMAQDDYFDHDSYDRSGGSLVYACNTWARLGSYYTGWTSAGENIAAGYFTPADVMSGWMNSQGHRENILRTSFWEIGVGYFEGAGSYYTRYWTQDFGRRFGVYPIVINNEARETESRDVSLYIYGAGVWTEMRLRNDNGSWTDWQPFQTTLDWMLGGGRGDHTVWVEMRDGGDSTVSSDDIYLDADPELGNLPDALGFAYSIPEEALLFDDYQATPLDVGSGGPLTWTVTTEGAWFTATPLNGTTSASFWLTPTTFVTDTVATYTGAVTVTVTAPAGVMGTPHRIDLTLQVGDLPFSSVYLPLTSRD
jgi:uncharacterized protein YkwD